MATVISQEIVVCPTCKGRGKVDVHTSVDEHVSVACLTCQGKHAVNKITIIEPIKD